jgi:uncharacterized repeat protein (TIGR01451 family)/uncharacterized protein (TIGR03382 family)
MLIRSGPRRGPRLTLAVLLLAASCNFGDVPEPAGGAVVPRGSSQLSQSFATGSLIIPMDTAYQDNGMLKAFGLVNELLKAGVPVEWVAQTGKAVGGTDFIASATDLQTAAVITNYGYRGGPFVVDSSRRTAALSVINPWQASNTTIVHSATTSFTADVRRTLTAAPRIAVFTDGFENIAFRYLNAAGIKDSINQAWPGGVLANYSAYPDAVTEADITGMTIGGIPPPNPAKRLLRADGTPNYCNTTSMHYNVSGTAGVTDAVTAQVRAWLTAKPTHAFMECQAALTFENDVNGLFLTTAGLVDDSGGAFPPFSPFVRQADSLFAQFDGAGPCDSTGLCGFNPVTGALTSAGLNGGAFKGATLPTLINDSTAPDTLTNVFWMTGNLDGNTANGKVSYLTGHSYPTTLPISGNQSTNGVRIFLDSLFESPCTAAEGAPVLSFTKSAPALTNASSVTFTLSYSNTGAGSADSGVITDTLPAGLTFSSATLGGTAAGQVVTWNLGNLAAAASGSVSVTATVAADGTYSNQAQLAYKVGQTPKTLSSNTTSTVRDTVAPVASITANPTNPTNQTTASFSFTSSKAGSTFSCKLDAGAAAACTSPKSYTALAAGSHTFTVTATDAAGNVSAPATYTWTIDLTAPVATITSSPANPTNQTTASFSFTSSKAGSTFSCKLDAGSAAACTSPKSYTALAAGSHTFTLTVTDAAGNVSAPAAFTWTIDLTAPVATITASPANPTNQTAASFSFNSSKAGSTFSCKLDAGAAAACASPQAYTGPLAAGGHTFTVTATDSAGNVSAPASYTWTIDLTPPVATITSSPANPTNQTTASFSFTSSKAGSTFSCGLDGAAATACASPQAYAGPLAAGSHTFTVTATDSAGNASAPASYTWTIDLTAPVATITASPANPTNQTTASFSFTSSKAGSIFSCKLDAGAAAVCTGPQAYAGPLAAGSHTFTVTAIDAAGNVSAPASSTWTIDTTPPSTTITAGPSSSTEDTTASFQFTANKPVVGYECAVDGSAFAPCQSPLSLAGITVGWHQLQVRARDQMGNLEASPARYPWLVMSPTITFAGGGCSTGGAAPSIAPMLALLGWAALVRRRRRREGGRITV